MKPFQIAGALRQIVWYGSAASWDIDELESQKMVSRHQKGYWFLTDFGYGTLRDLFMRGF